MKKTRRIFFVCVFIAFILMSCNLPFGNQTNQVDENAVNTSVAQTIAASTGNNIPLTPTPTVQVQVIPTITSMPLFTVAPPTTMPVTPTATEDTCNRASFIDDVTIPDGSKLFAGSAFVKTWRVKNIGSCTWTTGYALVTFSGDNLGAPAAVPFPANVPPGGTIDLSVNLVAPASNGNYQQNFKLRSDKGLLFGVGPSYNYPLYVKIEVIHLYLFTLAPTLDLGGLHFFPLEALIYDFAQNYCTAVWKTGSGVLPCPGTTSDAAGFVVRNDSPYLQNGTQYNGPTLFTHPQWIDNGTISGNYSGIDILNGYHFKATLGCGQGGNACDAILQLNYSSDGGPLKNFKQWSISYGNAPIDVDLDLSALAGHNVKFTLGVSANGTSGQDWVQWVNPRIVQ